MCQRLALLLLLAASGPLAADELARQIDRFFARYDADGDGRVSPAELSDRALFARLDRDGDGYVRRADFYQVTPEDSDMEDQGPKDGEDGPKAEGTVSFCLMMAVTAQSWERVRPFARPGDLYWGEVPGLPAKLRGLRLDAAKLPPAADLLGAAAAVADLRRVTAAQALEQSKALRGWIDAAHQANRRRKGYQPRPLLCLYAAEQVAAQPELAGLADVVLIGQPSWTAEQLAATDPGAPGALLARVAAGGRKVGVVLDVSEQQPRDAAEVGALVRAAVDRSAAHVAFEASDDRLHALLDALLTLR